MTRKIRTTVSLLGLAVFTVLAAGSTESEQDKAAAVSPADFAKMSDWDKKKVWAATILPKEERTMAYVMAQSFVKKVLPTPDSVDFPTFMEFSDEHAGMVDADDEVWEFDGVLYREYAVHTTFSAQNRYGATIRYDLNLWLYQNVSDNDNWRRFTINISDPSLEWYESEIFGVDLTPEQKPHLAEMPVGWSPTPQ